MLPANFEPIQDLDPEQPLRALSLPAWLQRCVESLGADYMNPEIPIELALSDAQVRAVVVRLDELSEAELACDVDHTMAVVAQLFESFATARLTEDQAKARAKGYLTALEGVPTWAVVEASRRWLQAKAGPQNYDFAPSPPRLREIADDVLCEVRAQRCSLERLLRARPPVVVENEPETRRRIHQGFSELLGRIKSRNAA
jgi:hypothetical protein